MEDGWANDASAQALQFSVEERRKALQVATAAVAQARAAWEENALATMIGKSPRRVVRLLNAQGKARRAVAGNEETETPPSSPRGTAANTNADPSPSFREGVERDASPGPDQPPLSSAETGF
jgi:hypothetical protein